MLTGTVSASERPPWCAITDHQTVDGGKGLHASDGQDVSLHLYPFVCAESEEHDFAHIMVCLQNRPGRASAKYCPSHRLPDVGSCFTSRRNRATGNVPTCGNARATGRRAGRGVAAAATCVALPRLAQTCGNVFCRDLPLHAATS